MKRIIIILLFTIIVFLLCTVIISSQANLNDQTKNKNIKINYRYNNSFNNFTSDSINFDNFGDGSFGGGGATGKW